MAEEHEVEESPPRTTEHPEPIPQSDMSYSNLFQDVRVSIDCIFKEKVELYGQTKSKRDKSTLTRKVIHNDGSLKSKVLADIPRYIKRVPLARFLDRLRQNGRTCFLLTNSEYYYTEQVMRYLLQDDNPKYEDWKQYWGILAFLRFIFCFLSILILLLDIIIVGANKPRFFSEGIKVEKTKLKMKINLHYFRDHPA